MTFITKPKVVHPGLPSATSSASRAATTKAACRRSARAAATTRSPPRSSQAFFELDLAPHSGREVVRHRLLVEDAGVFRERRARLQRRARPHAVGRDRRERRQSRRSIYIGVSGDGDSLSIGLGQFVHAIRRNLEHALHHREQRRVRAHEGPVLRVRRRRLEGEEGRGNQQPPIDPVPGRARARRHVRRAQLLRRQGAARAADQGRPAAQGLRDDRRDLAVRDVQRPRGLDEELRVHARVQPRRDRRRLRAMPAQEIKAAYDEGDVLPVVLHDGSRVLLRKLDKDFKVGSRADAIEYLSSASARRRDRDWTALCQRGRARPARGQRHDRDAAEPGAVRRVVPRRRRACSAAEALPLIAPPREARAPHCAAWATPLAVSRSCDVIHRNRVAEPAR